MYDKIKLWMPRTSETPDITPYLNSVEERADKETGECYTVGNMDGMSVYVRANGISVIGSLPKFINGENITTIDIHGARAAIQSLSDRLTLPMVDARVTGLEFGRVFVMENEVRRYLDRLGGTSRMNYLRCNENTLYYRARGKTPIKEYAFYDKGAEAREKGMIIPMELEEANLLRYEIRYKGRLCQQLKEPAITAATLIEERFYRKLVEIYRETYSMITKTKQLKTDIMSNISTVKDACNVFFATLISESSPTRIDNFVEDLKKRRIFEGTKRGYYSYVKKELAKISSMANVVCTDTLIKELDDEVMSVGAYS